eukprot:3650968-Amphidinium_carterae.1
MLRLKTVMVLWSLRRAWYGWPTQYQSRLNFVARLMGGRGSTGGVSLGREGIPGFAFPGFLARWFRNSWAGVGVRILQFWFQRHTVKI